MSVAFKDIVSITGKPGLYAVVKTDDKGIIVESLDDQRQRQMVRGNMMVSKLLDVSIYKEVDSEPLVDIFKAIEEKYGSDLPVSKKSSGSELMDFLGEVLPDYDQDRVYASNVKKLVAWYNILSKEGVTFEVEEEEPEKEQEEKKSESPKEKKKTSKASAKAKKKAED